jgi:hypothetical protein
MAWDAPGALLVAEVGVANHGDGSAYRPSQPFTRRRPDGAQPAGLAANSRPAECRCIRAGALNKGDASENGIPGSGVMGFPMAGHLKKGGHELTVYNRTAAGRRVVETHGGRQPRPRPRRQGRRHRVLCVGNDDDLQHRPGEQGAA